MVFICKFLIWETYFWSLCLAALAYNEFRLYLLWFVEATYLNKKSLLDFYSPFSKSLTGIWTISTLGPSINDVRTFMFSLFCFKNTISHKSDNNEPMMKIIYKSKSILNPPICSTMCIRNFEEGFKIFFYYKTAYTGGPRYMRSFYLRIRVFAIANWPYLWNLSPNLQSDLIFLYANSLYASQIFWSLSIA